MTENDLKCLTIVIALVVFGAAAAFVSHFTRPGGGHYSISTNPLTGIKMNSPESKQGWTLGAALLVLSMLAVAGAVILMIQNAGG